MQKSFIETLNQVRNKLPAIEEASALFDEEIVSRLEELAELNVSLIATDLKKGNYLGNRKIDIDIALNKNGVSEASDPLTIWLNTDTTVYYNKAIVTFVDGQTVTINFVNDDNQPMQVSTTADILAQFTKHVAFNELLENTAIIVDVGGTIGTIMRLSDTVGHSSNIESVQLYAISGDFVEATPSYYWAKTTSSLQTLANRVQDVIMLGNYINKIIALALKDTEIDALYAEIANMGIIIDNINNGTLQNAIDSASITQQNVTTTNADVVKTNENVVKTNENVVLADNILNANNLLKQAVTTLRDETKSIRDSIKALSAQASQLTAGQLPTVVYDSVNNKFVFGIPKGDKGDRGEAFKVSAMGVLSERINYDTQPKEFSFFARDVSLIYFKNTDTSGDWSVGAPFGKGDKGDEGDAGNGISSIVQVAGDGSAGSTDTYRITFTDASTFEFNVYNGSDPDVTLAYVDAHKTNVSNPHAVTKAQVGLSNVDNTSDEEKPVSTAQQIALDLKLNINSIVNNLTNGGTAVPLSAEQGKVLKGLIDDILVLLQSDNTDLNTLQELVNFITINRDTLNALGISNIAGLQTALDAKLGVSNTAVNATKWNGATMYTSTSASSGGVDGDIWFQY